jgi:carbamoyl-phosphate synthase large subunit
MKSVGEAMAIGRTFKEALQKALRSLETGRFGLGADGKDLAPVYADGSPNFALIEKKLRIQARPRLLYTLRAASRSQRPANS